MVNEPDQSNKKRDGDIDYLYIPDIVYGASACSGLCSIGD